MKAEFAPSVNIKRDKDRELEYIPTPNAKRLHQQILEDYKAGIHAFNIIGSYGTGKSSFFWAFEKDLKGDKDFFDSVNGHFHGKKAFDFLNIVGEYDSLKNVLSRTLGEDGLLFEEDVFKLLDNRYQQAENRGESLVIVVDEFGKFLEYAAQNQPEQELYFIQRLAEFVNDPNKDVLLLTALHQNFTAYAQGLDIKDQHEWEKVKGRLRELPFNEPVEQLLYLAAKRIEKKAFGAPPSEISELFNSVKASKLLPLQGDLDEKTAKSLYPFDVLSASVMVYALQKYGQNERSLFTFLESNDRKGLQGFFEGSSRSLFFDLEWVYNLLAHNYHSILFTKYNPHFPQWEAIRTAIERIEGGFENDAEEALALVKAIGLLSIFSSKGGRLDDAFLDQYAEKAMGISDAQRVIQTLVQKRIIRFVQHRNRYVLTEGTDLDIEKALVDADARIEKVQDVGQELRKYLDLGYVPAKAVQYKYGTPRFFQFRVKEGFDAEEAQGAIDGYIDLIISPGIGEHEVIEASKSIPGARLFVYFRNAEKIKETLEEIRKLELLISENHEDRVALRELEELKQVEEDRLEEEVQKSLYSGDTEKVRWVHKGTRKQVKSKEQFNELLSRICEAEFSKTPVFKNELVNRYKLPGAISAARRELFKAVIEYRDQEELGFPKDKFPPEKAIYKTLLERTGIHQPGEGMHFGEPTDKSFLPLWEAGNEFLESTKSSKRPILGFFDQLSEPPFKLKQGFLNIWIPLFLFMKRDEFGIYQKGSFIPEFSSELMDLIYRSPGDFEIKSFNIQGPKLDLFNKYRELIEKTDTEKAGKENFIDTIKPFLSFYKGLPEYSKKTQRLSDQAKGLRKAIESAKDPEQLFFEELPSALGYHDLDPKQLDESKLENYISDLESAIRELRTAYNALMERVEVQILTSIGEDEGDFPAYKKLLQERYKNVKDHLLLQHQKTFLKRLMSPLDDRASWLNSVVQATIQTPLDKIEDEEEAVLIERLEALFAELDDLTEIHAEDLEEGESVMKVQLTSLDRGRWSNQVRIPQGKKEKVEALKEKLSQTLEDDPNLNQAALLELLQNQLGDDE